VQGHLDTKHIAIALLLIHVIYALRNVHVQQQRGWFTGTRCEHGSLQVTPAETLKRVRGVAVGQFIWVCEELGRECEIEVERAGLRARAA
jgi:hypothetical protein